MLTQNRNSARVISWFDDGYVAKLHKMIKLWSFYAIWRHNRKCKIGQIFAMTMPKIGQMFANKIGQMFSITMPKILNLQNYLDMTKVGTNRQTLVRKTIN